MKKTFLPLFSVHCADLLVRNQKVGRYCVYFSSFSKYNFKNTNLKSVDGAVGI